MRLWMTQNFVRVPTEETSDKYLDYKEKETWEQGNFSEFFPIIKFHGYHWITLAFPTAYAFDKYRVFEDGELIAETEDVVCELPREPKGNLSVVWYVLDKGKYLGKWISVEECDAPSRNKSSKYNLSVVVPLYNSELFMCRTIDAILCSSLENIELILIDDGSTDKTWEIAQWYANNYWCVRAYHQENQWVSITRNKWLDLCKWKFMAFCDNDDIPNPNMYKILYDACQKYNSDIAIAQTLIRKDVGVKEYYLKCSANTSNEVVYSFDEMYEKRGTTANIFFVAVWNKIVKTSVARKAQFPTWYTWPWVLYEDVAYTGSLYSYIDKFVYCRDAVYMWDKRKQKTVGTASTRHKACDNEYVWKMFIYGFSYMLYNKSWKHLKRHDYTHFKRLIESYDKFNTPSPLRTYWDEKLKELINSQKLYENELIMADDHLKNIVRRFI